MKELKVLMQNCKSAADLDLTEPQREFDECREVSHQRKPRP